MFTKLSLQYKHPLPHCLFIVCSFAPLCQKEEITTLQLFGLLPFGLFFVVLFFLWHFLVCVSQLSGTSHILIAHVPQ